MSEVAAKIIQVNIDQNSTGPAALSYIFCEIVIIHPSTAPDRHGCTTRTHTEA
jgi:hypothetical protein